MSGSSWKVAYADFVTALMAFFLLMWIVNMTPADTKRLLAEYFTPEYWDNISSGGQGLKSGNISGHSGKSSSSTQKGKIDKTYYTIANKITQEIEALKLAPNALGANAQPDGVLFHVKANAFFNPNSIEISPEGREVLKKVASILNEFNVFMTVRGHSDPSEHGTDLYPSKWDLSSARATAVVHCLVDDFKINPNNLKAVGYADTQPLVPNTNEESRAQNRRIEFKMYKPEALGQATF